MIKVDALIDAQSYSSAILNILDDFAAEQGRLDAARRAVMNILEDFAVEKVRLGDTRRAMLNILDDFDIEKETIKQINNELRSEITERTRVEKALRQANAAATEANLELDAFSYSVAHDLRAPLRSIDGFSQALIEDCAAGLSEDGRTYLRYVRESAQHMAQLIDGLLSLSRLGRAELRRSRVDLASIGRTIFTRLQKEQPERMVELVMPAEMPAHGDAQLLQVVLENLLGNAWKFTKKLAQARIEFGQTSEEGCTVHFVRDNGAGFDMAYAGKLFEVFQRLHTVTEFEGTGIGLANAQRIIRRHHGRIWADGEVGKGATFYFTLGEEK